VKQAAAPPSPSGGSLVFRVGAGRLILRCLGVLLWRAADPRTLPVRPDGWEITRPDKSRLLPLIALLGWSAALLVAGIGLASWQHFRNLRSEFLRIPPGLSLDSTAEHMEQAARGPWLLLNPQACRKIARLAGAVREGQVALHNAAKVYEAAGETLRDLGPVARADRGRALVEPLRAALGEVRSPWHRETLVYRELQGALAPYLAAPSPASPRLQGRLTALTPDHALQLAVLTRDGRPLEAATSPLQPGAGFDLPIVPDGWLLLTDLVRQQRGVFEVREDTRIPLREWTQQPIRFPRGGASVQVHFTGATAQAAPSFPDLSPGARAELGWPQQTDRSTER
jgi:hypothetical protein